MSKLVDLVTDNTRAAGAFAGRESVVVNADKIIDNSAEMRGKSFGFGTVDFKPTADNINATPVGPALSA